MPAIGNALNSSKPARVRAAKLPAMSRFVLTPIAAVLACAASPDVTKTAGDPSVSDPIAEQNKQIVRRLFDECFTRGQLETLPELVADDYVGPAGVGAAADRGRSGLAKTVTALRGGFPDIQYTLAELVAEDDRVAVHWTWTGTHDGQFREQPPSHARVTNDGMAIFVLKDGKIVGGSMQTDRLGFLQQLGVVSPDIGGPPRK